MSSGIVLTFDYIAPVFTRVNFPRCDKPSSITMVSHQRTRTPFSRRVQALRGQPFPPYLRVFRPIRQRRRSRNNSDTENDSNSNSNSALPPLPTTLPPLPTLRDPDAHRGTLPPLPTLQPPFSPSLIPSKIFSPPPRIAIHPPTRPLPTSWPYKTPTSEPIQPPHPPQHSEGGGLEPETSETEAGDTDGKELVAELVGDLMNWDTTTLCEAGCSCLSTFTEQGRPTSRAQETRRL